MKYLFKFINIVASIVFVLFLLYSLFFFSNLGNTNTGKMLFNSIGNILWLSFMYGLFLELVTIPIALIATFFQKTYFKFIVLYVVILIIKMIIWSLIMFSGTIGY